MNVSLTVYGPTLLIVTGFELAAKSIVRPNRFRVNAVFSIITQTLLDVGTDSVSRLVKISVLWSKATPVPDAKLPTWSTLVRQELLIVIAFVAAAAMLAAIRSFIFCVFLVKEKVESRSAEFKI